MQGSVAQTVTQQIKGRRMLTILASLIPQAVATILIFTQYFYCSRDFQNRISAMILNLAIYERGSKFQTSSDIQVWCLGHEQQTKQYQIIKGN
jgi:hypothetical protein